MLNGSQAPVTCWYPKVTQSCERAVELQGKRARSMASKRAHKILTDTSRSAVLRCSSTIERVPVVA